MAKISLLYANVPREMPKKAFHEYKPFCLFCSSLTKTSSAKIILGFTDLLQNS